jgi:hypothetical protein
MKTDELRSEVLGLGFVVDGKSYCGKLKNTMYSDLVEKIYADFYYINGRNPIKISEAIYCLYHIVKPFKCLCGKDTSFIDFKNGYNKNCSSRCAALNPEAQWKLKQTNILRYGVDNPLKNPQIQEQIRETMKTRYGVDNPTKSEGIRNKAKETNRQRYGSEFVLQNKEIRKKGKDTMVERYGVDHPLKSIVFQTKQRETNLDRLGVEYPTQNATVVSKSVETNFRLHGVKNSMQREEVKDKAKATWTKKYGVDNPMLNQKLVNDMLNSNIKKYGVKATSQEHYSFYAREILFNKEKFNDFMNGKSLNEASKILGIDPSTVGDYCKNYDIVISRSSYETEIATFLDSLGLQYLNNTRSIIPPKELDFYLPDYNLAIEFNGLYWHSHEINGNKRYHLDKFLSCQSKGIQLIMINEDEWIERSSAIKNKIKNVCKLSNKGVSARKLTIKQIPNTIGNEFMNQYHIQGESSGVIISFGAHYDDLLVGVIQFSKQRNTGDIELTRFCSDDHTHAGMFSKLLSYSIKSQDYKKIISFADRRYSKGDVYEKNGFSAINVIPPDYRYIKNLKTFHKSTFKKKRIQEKFGLDVTNLTESEAMTQLGYRKIYDCGKIKYEWKHNEN